MGDFYVKTGSSWQLVDTPYVKVGGSWQPCTNVYVKTGGSWQEVWAATGGGSSFSPTILGKTFTTTPDYVTQSIQEDEDPVSSQCYSRAQIWVIDTGSDIEIRVASAGNGNQTDDDLWYNTSDVSQGAPDTDRVPGTKVFGLGERTGVTVNIYTVSADGVIPTLQDGWTRTKLGTFTDDNKSTFTTLSTSTDYGYLYRIDADDPAGTGEVSGDFGEHVVQFTFRKTGYTDYTVTFEQYVDATASQVETEK